MENDITVQLSENEPQDICKLGQGPPCCIFLVCGANGFQCAKYGSLGSQLARAHASGTTAAKGLGGWEGCHWPES